jgi:ABC-type tungstate transport system permease subunit
LTYDSAALADSFIQESVKNGSEPFSIGWILSDTTYTIRHLQSGEADMGITYSPAAEKIAGDQGIIDPKTHYLFRDHFLIVGPVENPANLSNSSDVEMIMARIFQSAENNTATTEIPTRWLSRYDKSATNIKESQLWLSIGQVSDSRRHVCAHAKHSRFPGPQRTPPGTTST